MSDKFKGGLIVAVGITATFIICMLIKSCNSESKTETTITRDTIWIASKDTEHNITPTIQPKPTYITNNYTYEAQQGTIDTGMILRDYFNKRGYQDTIKNDSIDIILHEEVYKNELIRKKVAYKWKAPERIVKETITKTQTMYKGGLFIGPEISWGYKGNTNPYGIGIQCLFTKNKLGIGLAADPFQRYVNASFLIRVK